MNRKVLLKWARAQTPAYEGPEDLDKLKAWATENLFEVTDGDGNGIDAIWANVPKAKKVVLNDPDPTDDDADGDDGIGRKANPVQQVNATAGNVSPKNLRNMSMKRAYDRRAAKGQTVFQDADAAEAFGAWFRQVWCKANPGIRNIYTQYAADRDIVQKAMGTTVNTAGGAYVPEEFSADVIRIREQYGVVASAIASVPMSRDTIYWPRETSDIVVYNPDENAEITESQMATDNVRVSLFKMAGLSRMSNELIHDAAVNVADRVANSIAYSFAKKEDDITFNGDGTSTYFGVNGIRNKFRSVLEAGGGTWTSDANKANMAGLIVASGNAWSEITLPDLDKLPGRLPTTYDNNAAWYCHKQFFYEVMLRADTVPAASVTSSARDFTLQNRPVPVWRGAPVRFVQVMPKVEGNSEICAIYGDLNAAMKLGRSTAGMSVDLSDQRYFERDQVAIRANDRIGVTVHDVGNYSATASLREPGPIVALVTQNA